MGSDEDRQEVYDAELGQLDEAKKLKRQSDVNHLAWALLQFIEFKDVHNARQLAEAIVGQREAAF